VEAKGLRQIVDVAALEPLVDRVLAANADAVARFKSGNANVVGALIGLVVKESKGQGQPKIISDLIRAKLERLP